MKIKVEVRWGGHFAGLREGINDIFRRTAQARYISALVISLVYFCATPCQANVLQKKSLQEQIENSDLVLLASGTAPQDCQLGQDHYKCVKLEDSTFVRGNEAPTGEIYLILSWHIRELDIFCCDEGQKYMFILSKVDKNYYRAYNGVYSIIKMSDEVAPYHKP